MKIDLLLAFLVVSGEVAAQCPNIRVDMAGGHCVGDTLTVQSSGRMGQIVWYNGSQVVKTANGVYTESPATVVAGGNGEGRGANQLDMPSQIFIGAGSDSLYIADMQNWRIQGFPPGSSSATFGGTVVLPSTISGILGNDPICSGVCRDAGGNFYAEEGPDIVKFGPGVPAGQFLAYLTPTAPHTDNWDQSKIYYDNLGNLYIMEPGNNRIQRWAAGATAGVTVAGGNGAGSAANQLNYPLGMYLDGSGNIYVADTRNDRIQKWAPGATLGVTVAGGNGAGAAANQLYDPYALCIDSAGNMYIADCVNNRVQWWAPGAVSGLTVVGGNGQGGALNQLDHPQDILFHKGYLYTCDTYNQRVLKSLPALTYTIDSTLVTQTPGVYMAVVLSGEGCSLNTNSIDVLPLATANMTISGLPNPVCSNDSVVFDAGLSVAGLTPVYQWMVNGQVAGDSPRFVDRSPENGDVVVGSIRDDSVCTIALSNSITLVVNPAPMVVLDSVVSLLYGQQVTLEPTVSGAIGGYTWSPATGLSGSTVLDPVADPLSTTVYTLEAVGTDGCVASGSVKVAVYIPLRVPNAFTPNGDGRNDVFYVLGGPMGLVIKDFLVFDRWGQRVFQVRDAPPGDPAYGWNGEMNGSPAPAGTYIYLIAVRTADGHTQTYRGTVEVIR